MSYRATLRIKRLCISGYKDGTLYGYGATPDKARQEISEYVKRVNGIADKSTPIIKVSGEFEIQEEA